MLEVVRPKLTDAHLFIRFARHHIRIVICGLFLRGQRNQAFSGLKCGMGAVPLSGSCCFDGDVRSSEECHEQLEESPERRTCGHPSSTSSATSSCWTSRVLCVIRFPSFAHLPRATLRSRHCRCSGVSSMKQKCICCQRLLMSVHQYTGFNSGLSSCRMWVSLTPKWAPIDAEGSQKFCTREQNGFKTTKD